MIKKLLFNLCMFNVFNLHAQWQSETIYNSLDGYTKINFSNVHQSNNSDYLMSNVGSYLSNFDERYSYFNNFEDDGIPTFSPLGFNNFIFAINNPSNTFWGVYQDAQVVEKENRNNFIIAGTIKDSINLSVYITNYNSTTGLFSNTNVYTQQSLLNDLPITLKGIKKIGPYWVIIGHIGYLSANLISKQIVFIFNDQLSLVNHAIYSLNNTLGINGTSPASEEIWIPRDLIYNETDKKLIIVGNIDKIEFLNPAYIKRYGYYCEVDFDINNPTLILDKLNIHVVDPQTSSPPTLYEGTTCARIKQINKSYHISGTAEQSVLYTGPYIAKIHNNGFIFERKLYFENPINATIEEAVDFDYNNITKNYNILTAEYNGNHPYMSSIEKQSLIKAEINFNFLNKINYLSSNFNSTYPNRITSKFNSKLLSLGGTENYFSNNGFGLRLDFSGLGECDFDEVLNDTINIHMESHFVLPNNLVPQTIGFDSLLNLNINRINKDYSINCEYNNHNSNFKNIYPSNDSNLDNINENKTYNLYNFSGILIKTNILEKEINELNLPNGIYILISNDGSVKKISLNKF